MPGEGHTGTVGGEVEVDVGAAGEETGVEIGEQAVGAGQHVARGRAHGGVRVHGGADLPHEGRRVDVVALYVADGDGGRVLVETDDVVEVAADAQSPGRREVAGGDVQPRHAREGVGQQGGLQTVGEMVLGVVEPGAVQGLPHQTGQRREGGPLAGREDMGPPVGEQQGADGPAGGDQREHGPGGHPVLVRHGRIGRSELLERRPETGDPRRHDVGAGDGRGERDAVELLQQLRAVATLPDDPQVAFLRDHHHHALRAQCGHQLVGGLLDHVRHADGLGQGGGQVHQVVQHRGAAGPGGLHRRGRGRVRVRAAGGDADAQPRGVRVQLEGQPRLRRAQHREGLWSAADQRGPVAVLHVGHVHPGQRLPRQRAHQQGPVDPEQLGRPRGDEGQASVEVQRARTARQAVHERGQRGRLDGGGRARGRRRQGVGTVRRQRLAAVEGPLQAVVQTAAARPDGVLLTLAQPGRMTSGPQQHQPAPDGGARGQRRGRQPELVGQDQRQPRILAGHVLPAAGPHQAAFAHRVRDGHGVLQPDPAPRSGHLLRDPRDQHLPHGVLARRQHVQDSSVRTARPHHCGHRGVHQPSVRVRADRAARRRPPRTSPISGHYARTAATACEGAAVRGPTAVAQSRPPCPSGLRFTYSRPSAGPVHSSRTTPGTADSATRAASDQ